MVPQPVTTRRPDNVFLHAKIGASVFHKHIHFFETAFIQQHGYAFAGCIFSFFMLFCNCFITSTHACCSPAFDKLFYFFKLIAHFTYDFTIYD